MGGRWALVGSFLTKVRSGPVENEVLLIEKDQPRAGVMAIWMTTPSSGLSIVGSIASGEVKSLWPSWFKMTLETTHHCRLAQVPVGHHEENHRPPAGVPVVRCAVSALDDRSLAGV